MSEDKKPGKRDRRHDVIRQIMNHSDGRWWINRLILTADPHGNPVTADNPFITYYKNGEQAVTSTLLSNVQKAAGDNYLVMLREAKDKVDLPYDANDEEAIEKATLDADAEHRKMLLIIKTIMQHADGRWWVYDLLEYCMIFSNPMVAGDPYMTYANNGKKNIGRFILIDIQAVAAEEYLMMIRENWKGV